MKDLAQKFLSDADREKVAAAVRTAESKTAGEIVPMVVSASYHYPAAVLKGSAALALPPALLLTTPVGGLFWLAPGNMWVFLTLFAAWFAAWHMIINRVAWLKRWFISQTEIEEEVAEAAHTHFYREQLHKTRDKTGILIFISVLEHKVWVLADEAISRRVPQSDWDAVVQTIVTGIKQGRQAEAICEAVARVGRMIETHFPVRPDDVDELQSLIVRD